MCCTKQWSVASPSHTMLLVDHRFSSSSFPTELGADCVHIIQNASDKLFSFSVSGLLAPKRSMRF